MSASSDQKQNEVFSVSVQLEKKKKKNICCFNMLIPSPTLTLSKHIFTI